MVKTAAADEAHTHASSLHAALKDRPGHRRFSLKQALVHSDLSLQQIITDVPVYRYLADLVSPAALRDTIIEDIATLRASGNSIEWIERTSGERVYHLEDSASIHVDTRAMNMALLAPLLDYKAYSAPETLAHVGITKALGTAARTAQHVPLAAGLPAGEAAPVVANAIQHQHAIQCIYQSLNDAEPRVRTLVPYALEVHHDAFYTRAINETGHERLYKVERMRECVELSSVVTQARIERDKDDWFAPVDVIVECTPDTCAPLVARSHALPEGSFPLDLASSVRGASEQRLIRMLYGVDLFTLYEELAFYGSDIRVLWPQWLATDVAQRAASAYSAVTHRLHVGAAATLRRQSGDQHTCLISDGKGAYFAPDDSACDDEAYADTASLAPRPAASKDRALKEPRGGLNRLDESLSRREAYFTYLLAHGPTTLKDLADHFSVSMAAARIELRDLFTTEIIVDGQPTPLYDLSMPDWNEGEPLNGEWLIEAIPSTDQLVARNASFTLAEVIAVIGAIDTLLTVAAGDHERVLSDMRASFVQATQTAGYGSALWAPPSTRFSSDIARAMSDAIEQRHEIDITYWTVHADGRARAQKRTIWPFAIDPQINPLVASVDPDGNMRAFRLDRISAVTPTGTRYKKSGIARWKRAYRNRPNDFDGTQVQLTCTPQARWTLEELPGARLCDSRVPGVITIEATIRDVQWLRTLLIRLGDAVVAVQPHHVADMLTYAMNAVCSAWNSSITHSKDDAK